MNTQTRTRNEVSESRLMSVAGLLLTFSLLLWVFRSGRVFWLALPLAAGLLTGLAASLLLPDFSVHEALCVGAGFGYYSLSSILIENSGNSSLASVAHWRYSIRADRMKSVAPSSPSCSRVSMSMSPKVSSWLK